VRKSLIVHEKGAAAVTKAPPTGCLVLALVLASSPALAQQPLQESAKRAATVAARDATEASQLGASHRTTFWSGTILALAGGAAVILGTTTLKTGDTTSGNAPSGAYDRCIALKSNPVYQGNQCDVLKGPNTGVVIGGAAAAAAGVTLMMLGRPNSSIQFGAAGVGLRHSIRF